MTERQAPDHDELPLPDCDHLPIGSLAGRVRTLVAAGVEELLAYERAHAHRTAVLELLECRRTRPSPEADERTFHAPRRRAVRR